MSKAAEERRVDRYRTLRRLRSTIVGQLEDIEMQIEAILSESAMVKPRKAGRPKSAPLQGFNPPPTAVQKDRNTVARVQELINFGMTTEEIADKLLVPLERINGWIAQGIVQAIIDDEP